MEPLVTASRLWMLEVARRLRRPRHYLLLLAVAALLALMLRATRIGSPAASKLLPQIINVQLLLVLLVAAVSAAGSVIGDRMSGRLSLFTITPARRVSYVAAKFLVQLTLAVSFVLAGLPVLAYAAKRIYLDAPPADIPEHLYANPLQFDLAPSLLFVPLITVAFVVALGLLISTAARRFSSAVMLTCAILVIIWIVLPLLGLFLISANEIQGNTEEDPPWRVAMAQTMLRSDPLFAFQVPLAPGAVPEWAAESPMNCYLIYATATIVLLSLNTIWLERLGNRSTVASTNALGRNWSRLAKLLSFRRTNDFRVWRNPVAWRESIGGGHFGVVRLAVFALSVSISAIVWGGWIDDWQRGLAPLDSDIVQFATPLVATGTLAWILVGLQATACISHETHNGTIDVLLSTPLKSSEVVLGKLVGVLRNCWFAFLFPVLLSVTSWWHGTITWRSMLLAFAFLIAGALFSMCQGICCSALFGSTRKSMAVGLLILAGINADSLLELTVDLSRHDRGRVSRRRVEPLLISGPARDLRTAILDPGAFRSQSPTQVSPQVWKMDIRLALVRALAFVVISALSVVWTIQLIDRRYRVAQLRHLKPVLATS